MRFPAILVISVLLAACSDPEIPTVPSGLDVVKQTRPTASAEARLAKYDGRQMRARVFTKRNGPRQLVATKALRFEKAGGALRLATRDDRTREVWVGEGVELAFVVGHAEAYPACEVGVPLEEQPIQPCTVPWCDEVDNVEPCQEVGQGEGGGGGGGAPWAPFAAVLANSVLLDTIASAFAQVVAYSPVAIDSVPPDSVALVITDSNSVLVTGVYMADGLVLASIVDVGEYAVVTNMDYDGDRAVVAMTMSIFSASGDTLSLELTQELPPRNTRTRCVCDTHGFVRGAHGSRHHLYQVKGGNDR